jgi:hypothetical protein
MKAKGLDYKFKVVVFLFLIVFGTDFSAKGDVGGGSGKAATPFVPGKEVKEEEIVFVKNISKRSRTIEELKLKGKRTTQYGEKVGLNYVKDQNVSDEPFFEFRGTTETGDTMNIDFSEVKSFTLLRIDNRWFARDRALLQVVQFPYISPKDLLSIKPKPSYSDLKKNYTKSVRLWVTLEGEAHSELCIIGVKWSDEEKYEVLSKLRDIELNSEVILEYGNFEVESIGRMPSIWWAIPSVIQDERYPYKLYQLR